MNSSLNWVKVHRRRILPETLIAYRLPWEWDSHDSDYLLIKQYLSEDLMVELFEHTKRLLNKPTESAYVLARCDKTSKRLSFDVKLRTPPGKVDDWDDRSPDGDLWYGGRSKTVEKNPYCDRANFSYSQSFDDTRVALYRLGPSSGGLAPQFTWTHIRRDPKDFEECLNLATSSPGLDDEDIALILSLLKKVRHGAKPCFAEETGQGRSATSLAFPYFSVKAIREGTGAWNASLYPARSLLELAYSLDSTHHRDMEQAICKARQYGKGQALHIPQLWSVIVNSRFIVTSCPMYMFSKDIHSFKIMDIPTSPSPLSPLIVRVTDPWQRLFFIPMDYCKTWFALIDNVMEKCLRDYDLENHDFQLQTLDQLVVQAHNWDAVVKNHTSTFLNLYVRLLKIEWELPPEKPPKPGYAPKKSDRMSKAPTAESWDADSVYKDAEPKANSDISVTTDLEAEEDQSQDEDSETWKKKAWLKGDPESLPPNRFPRHPLPPSSGVVVNSPRPKFHKRRSNIYFVPKSSKDSKVAVEKDSKPSQQDTSSETAPLNEFPGSDIARLTSPGSGKLKPSVPPVFTWALGGEQRSSDSNTDQRTTENPATLLSGTISGSGAGARAGRSSHDSESEEERLRNVCFHIHTNLLDAFEPRERDLYRTTRSSTSHQVASLVNKAHRVSDEKLVIPDHVSSSPHEGKSNLSVSKLQRTYDHLSSLFEFFIPVAYPSEISGAYWGALHVIFEHVSEMFDMSKFQNQNLHSSKRTALEYYIVDLSGESGYDLRHRGDLEYLTKPFSDCNVCRNQKAYSTLSDAQTHLFTDHFPLKPEERHLVSSHWISSSRQYPYYVRHADGHAILDRLHYHLEELERSSREIRSGVCARGVFDRKSYKLPSALVEAFGRILMMLVYAASVAKSACNSCNKHDQFEVPVSFIDEDPFDMVSSLGFQAETAMHEARKQVILMACTDDVADTVSYEAVSPEFVMILIMDEIHNRVAYRNTTDSVLAIYQDYISKLQFQVNVRPRKRLLQPIAYLLEELSILGSVMTQQQLVLKNFRNILNPTSFQVTTETRFAAFKMEEARIDRILAGMRHELESIKELSKRAETLSYQTRSAVEAREEDHGKAILAFTIVTVIFLPMSFVTSFFGMNTSDIRDLPQGQWIFWAVALPISAVTIGLALIIGFHGDGIREAIGNMVIGRGALPPSPPHGSNDMMIVVEEEVSSHDSLPH